MVTRLGVSTQAFSLFTGIEGMKDPAACMNIYFGVERLILSLIKPVSLYLMAVSSGR